MTTEGTRIGIFGPWRQNFRPLNSPAKKIACIQTAVQRSLGSWAESTLKVGLEQEAPTLEVGVDFLEKEDAG